ncbi:DoxX family protein [Lichenifustis flavocetrariae]|uniref:DoxX family protein n=1 Tax=Lichenifustis flavocetrariae TaxID=2949735 RepID=A0AA42CIH4_9HYPH|nr:DoxX family protein [Lichenifustis flavocetrariae]MCW6508583.1 DoxX family protein [Lichenifustis flavocetrariae]
MNLNDLPHAGARWVLLGLMAVLYIGFGFVHVFMAEAFLPIMPDWVPAPRATVIATGVCEIAGGLGLFVPRTRWLAGIMLALYAVCVYPANIKHAFGNVDIPSLPHSWWYHGPRLAFQPVFVWWALFCAGVIDWPFRKRRSDTAASLPGARLQTP